MTTSDDGPTEEEHFLDGDYLAILAYEFRGGERSFCLRLRCDLEWDKEAFDRLTYAMRRCCEAYQYSQEQLEAWKLRTEHLTDEQLADDRFASELFMEEGRMLLPRWLVEGFWYVPQFVKDWTSHPAWEEDRAREPEYYKKAYKRLDALANWFFFGREPWIDVEKGWASTFVQKNHG